MDYNLWVNIAVGTSVFIVTHLNARREVIAAYEEGVSDGTNATYHIMLDRIESETDKAISKALSKLNEEEE